MVTKPQINDNDLIQIINERYSLNVEELAFVPKGEVSWGYVVTCSNGDKYFLKIHKAKNLAPERFQLLFDLHAKAGVNNIIYPKETTTGELEILINGYPGVLFNYVEGKNAHEVKLEDEQYTRLGQLLGKIHQSLNLIEGYPVEESFEIPSKEEFELVMKYVETHSEEGDPIKQEALELFRKFKDKFLDELKILEDLKVVLGSSKIQFVLCHGEPSPGNILVTPKGEVYLIDWDEPIIAPKEKDTLFFNKHLEPFFKGYREYSDDRIINEQVSGFYAHLWNVSEIGDWGGRLFLNKSSREEIRHSLDELKVFLNYSGLGKSSSQ